MARALLRALPISVVAWTLAATSLAHPPSVPHVTRLHLSKGSHELTLFDGERQVASFAASIGPGGPGPKRQEGDNVTPTGRYHVLSHQPSKYRVFLRLDYPNADDAVRFAAAKETGELPTNAHIGGDIGIHGTPQGAAYDEMRPTLRGVDWTAGCIAVTDEEIDQIAAWVHDGAITDIDD